MHNFRPVILVYTPSTLPLPLPLLSNILSLMYQPKVLLPRRMPFGLECGSPTEEVVLVIDVDVLPTVVGAAAVVVLC